MTLHLRQLKVMPTIDRQRLFISPEFGTSSYLVGINLE